MKRASQSWEFTYACRPQGKPHTMYKCALLRVFSVTNNQTAFLLNSEVWTQQLYNERQKINYFFPSKLFIFVCLCVCVSVCVYAHATALGSQL